MKLRVLDIGRAPFERAFALQEETVAARQSDSVPDTLILVEHDPVYTLGRNADPANVLESPEALAQRGIRLVQTTRGGQVTYHGPGQLVGYPVIRLRDHGKGVLCYVESLERMLMQVLASHGQQSHTDPENRGVWIGDAKIAALGVRVTRHVTMHGFALNVAVNLSDYSGIVPCGIKDRSVTSLDLLCPGITLDAVKPVVISAFRDVFGYECIEK